MPHRMGGAGVMMLHLMCLEWPTMILRSPKKKRRSWPHPTVLLPITLLLFDCSPLRPLPMNVLTATQVDQATDLFLFSELRSYFIVIVSGI